MNSKISKLSAVYVTRLDRDRQQRPDSSRWQAVFIGRRQDNFVKQSDFARWAVLPMRLLVVYGFIEHGFAKLSRGPDAFAGILQHLGVSLPHLAAWLTIGTELIGGLALLFGAFVLWASIPAALVLLVATVSIHLPYGFSSVKLLSVSTSGARSALWL